jgi:hypothetical protein
MQTHEIELGRRGSRQRAVTVQRHIAHGQRDAAERSRRRGEKREQGD